MTGLRAAAGFVVGLITGVCGVVLCRHLVVIAGRAVPWGVVVAIAGSAVVVFAVGAAVGQVAAFCAVVGWFVPVALPVLIRPGGDEIPGQDGVGLAYLLLGTMVVAVSCFVSPRRR